MYTNSLLYLVIDIVIRFVSTEWPNTLSDPVRTLFPYQYTCKYPPLLSKCVGIYAHGQLHVLVTM